MPPDTKLPSSESVVAFTERMVSIQEKTGVALHLPATFVDADVAQIQRIAQVLEDGYLALPIQTITLRRDREDMRLLVEHFEERPDQPLLFLDQEVVDIFGTQVPLGRRGRLLVGYKVVAESLSEVKAGLANAEAAGPFDLRVAAADGAVVQQVYERWLSSEDQAKLPAHVFPQP